MREPNRLRNEDFLEAVSRAVLQAIEGGNVIQVIGGTPPVTTEAGPKNAFVNIIVVWPITS
jgi:hypothetical protein